MKTNYNLIGIAILSIGLLVSGKKLVNGSYLNHSRTTVIYNEDGPLCILIASFPVGKSNAIGQYIKTWIKKEDKSFHLSGDTAYISSTGGPHYKVYMDETYLKIIANRNQFADIAFHKMKKEYKAITDFITIGTERNNKK